MGLAERLRRARDHEQMRDQFRQATCRAIDLGVPFDQVHVKVCTSYWGRPPEDCTDAQRLEAVEFITEALRRHLPIRVEEWKATPTYQQAKRSRWTP